MRINKVVAKMQAGERAYGAAECALDEVAHCV